MAVIAQDQAGNSGLQPQGDPVDPSALHEGNDRLEVVDDRCGGGPKGRAYLRRDVGLLPSKTIPGDDLDTGDAIGPSLFQKLFNVRLVLFVEGADVRTAFVQVKVQDIFSS